MDDLDTLCAALAGAAVTADETASLVESLLAAAPAEPGHPMLVSVTLLYRPAEHEAFQAAVRVAADFHSTESTATIVLLALEAYREELS